MSVLSPLEHTFSRTKRDVLIRMKAFAQKSRAVSQKTQILKLTDVAMFRSFETMIRNTMRRFLAIMIKIITIAVIGVIFLTMICP